MSLDPLLSAPLAVQIHAFSAIAALTLGAVVLFRRKGTPTHKLMGRVWAGLMLLTATAAIFINEIRLIGPFSPIHIFVIFTYTGVAQGIWYIRRGEATKHRAAMIGLYFGSMGLAGAFTFLPGRRMHEVLFGADAGWTPSVVMIAAVLGATAYFWWRLSPKRRALV